MFEALDDVRDYRVRLRRWFTLVSSAEASDEINRGATSDAHAIRHPARRGRKKPDERRPPLRPATRMRYGLTEVFAHGVGLTVLLSRLILEVVT